MDKNVHLRTGPKWTSHGITLIALIITIIILLILAGITVGALTGDNSLINQAGEAKEEAEIANEKEVVEKATVDSMGKNKYGNLEEDELQTALDNQAVEGKTEATDTGEEFEVFFVDSNRYYIVDNNGNIKGYETVILDPYPGDITKDTDGNTLAGTEEEPYEIWCIEDLCDFSNRVNQSSKGSYVKLMTNLDFNASRSYKDGSIVTEGEIASCSTKEELKDNLTNREKSGFIPIGKLDTARFGGTFEGNGKEIRNIYINYDGKAGLFGVTFGAKIKNLGITGSITGTRLYRRNCRKSSTN